VLRFCALSRPTPGVETHVQHRGRSERNGPPTGFAGLGLGVGHHNDEIADSHQVRRRAIELHRSAAALTRSISAAGSRSSRLRIARRETKAVSARTSAE
jgi:hypothetical protein